ncbi:MAG: hypothetical protein MMC33_002033 [Icmadophila ericetorum]|nr:hypothetical protein [Icmadophila ericetorum]
MDFVLPEFDEKPTLVIVQGAFQDPQIYETLKNILSSQGFPILHPPLPSCSDVQSPEFPSVTLVDDALAIRMELVRLVEYASKIVVVIMHSYGGLVGSEAIPEYFSYSERHAKGLQGGVIHLFYVAAFLLREGESMVDVFADSGNTKVKPDGRVYVQGGERLLYNDLTAIEASHWASHLIAQSHAVQATRVTRSAHQYIPSTYLICENDNFCLRMFQEHYAAQAKAQVERCSSGHSPMLSQPDMLAERIVAATDKALAEA